MDHQPFKLLIAGASGTGKSRFFTALLQSPHYDKVIVYDAEGETSMRLGLPPVRSFEDLDRAAFSDTRIICFDPVFLYPGRGEDGFAFLCGFTMDFARLGKRKILFACDELQRFISPTSSCETFFDLLETGRRYGVDCIFVAQQPNLISNRLRNQLTQFACFQQQDERALDFCEQVGLDSEIVRSLPVGVCMNKDLRRGGEPKKLKVFVDSNSEKE